MTFFGKNKRRPSSPKASRGRKPINNNHDKKSQVCQTQTSMNLAPPPPYLPPAPIQVNIWPPPQSPYRYPHPGITASQAKLHTQPSPPRHPFYNHNVKGRSCTNLPTAAPNPNLYSSKNGIGEWQHRTADCLSQGVGLCDLISSKLDTVITLIDGERFSGDERELGKVSV